MEQLSNLIGRKNQSKKFHIFIELFGKDKKVRQKLDFVSYDLDETLKTAYKLNNNLSGESYENFDIIVTKTIEGEEPTIVKTIVGNRKEKTYVVCRDGIQIKRDGNISFMQALDEISKFREEDLNAEPRLIILPVYSYFQHDVISRHTYVI